MEMTKMLLMCPQCQAKASAKCDCGVAYVPAGDLARREVIRSPQKSDRAIAKQLGISDFTVRQARKETTARNHAVEKRQGIDGKMRRMPMRKEARITTYPGFNRLKAAWFMATEEAAMSIARGVAREGEMFLKWVKEQQERKPCNVEYRLRLAKRRREEIKNGAKVKHRKSPRAVQQTAVRLTSFT